MSYKITLPATATKNDVYAGVVFKDGVATVEELGVSKRGFFEMKGATIETVDDPETERPEGTPTRAWTRKHLIGYARQVGFKVEDDITKRELLEVLGL